MNYSDAINKVESYKNMIGKIFYNAKDDVTYDLQYITVVRDDYIVTGEFAKIDNLSHFDKLNNNNLIIGFVCSCLVLHTKFILVEEASFLADYSQTN